MPEFHEVSDLSLVTAILPRDSFEGVLEKVLLPEGINVLSLKARGTLLKDRWYQSFLPLLSPEQEIIQLLVPNGAVDRIMENIVGEGRLRLSGAGAIYNINCQEVVVSEEYPLKISETEAAVKRPIVRFKEDLVGIFCITQSEDSEAIARSAVQAGSHGPTIYYCEGRGIRDQLLLLRITKTAEKEFIQVVVDSCDADPVFNAMAEAGDLTAPGHGLIYSVPIEKGLINVASVYGPARHSASTQQIIAAIDDLSGGSDWRAQNVVDVERISGSRPSFNFLVRERQHRYLQDSRMLTCIARRTVSSVILDTALHAGAPAASIAYGKFIEHDAQLIRKGTRLNREKGIIKMILPPEKCAEIRQAIQETANQREFGELCFFTYPVHKALTYLGARNRE